jgi:3-methyladenine DNA glycosylase/8-oxoguanine DNA glycosylase
MNNLSSHKNGGLCFDPEEAVRYLSEADSALARLISVAGPFSMKVRAMHSPFEALARNIIYQQLNGVAAATIHARVLALFGGRRLRPTDILEASAESLRGAGLSRNKLEALRDHDIIETLTQVRGIGRWTAEMLLMSRLGRPDVLPVGDFGVRKGFAILHRMEALPTPKELARYGEKWRPYRTVASWYMWRVVELPPGALSPQK